MTIRRATWLLFASLVACTSRPGSTLESTALAIGDAGCDDAPPAACVDDGNEDCTACWKQLGTCCYGDSTILGMAAPLTSVCRSQHSCAICCNECAALSCDELHARNVCPNPGDEQPDAGSNGWGANGWTSNGFVPLQALADTVLADATLNQQKFNQLLQTQAERLFIADLIQCALPQGAVVKTKYGAEPLVFPGQWGLAPDWATMPCDGACREWVTACMLARNNYYGVPVAISIRGPHPSLAVGADEARIATVEEGAFFGNMFADNPYGWACRGDGDDAISTIVRRCTFANPGAGYPGAPASCWYYDQGTPCASVCSGRNDAGAYTQCEGVVPPQSDAGADGGANDAGALQTFGRVVTVYLKHSELGPLPANACR